MVDDKTLQARQFVSEVHALAKKYGLPFFVVTEGASGMSNGDCEAVEHAIEWEIAHKIDPEHDWGHE